MFLVIGCLALACCSPSRGDTDQGPDGLRVSATSAVARGVVTETLSEGDFANTLGVFVTRVDWGVGDRWRASTEQVEEIPLPPLGQQIAARNVNALDVPEDTELILFLGYIGPTGAEWEWTIQLALFPDDQRPVPGLSPKAVDELSKVLFDTEVPEHDTVRALIELVQEAVQYSKDLNLNGNPELGPRQRRLQDAPNATG